MTERTSAERALVTLLNKVSDGLGDSLHMTDHLLEGSVIYPGDREAGVEEMVLGYEVWPGCDLDDDGYPEAEQPEFETIHLRLEVRERGVSEGDEVGLVLPRDWNRRLSSEDDEALSDWLQRVGAVTGVHAD